MWNVWDSDDEAVVLRNRHPRRDWANVVACPEIRHCSALEAVDYCFWQTFDVRYVADRLTWWKWRLSCTFLKFVSLLFYEFVFSFRFLEIQYLVSLCVFQQLKTTVTDILSHINLIWCRQTEILHFFSLFAVTEKQIHSRVGCVEELATGSDSLFSRLYFFRWMTRVKAAREETHKINFNLFFSVAFAQRWNLHYYYDFTGNLSVHVPLKALFRSLQNIFIYFFSSFSSCPFFPPLLVLLNWPWESICW